MPYVGNLFDFLASVDLQQYHHDFVNKLGVTTVEHVTYVQSDDVLKLGMTAPEWRRLQASMKKARKGKLTSVKDKITGGKQKPTIVRVSTKDGAPTGGHIIPSTAIQITDRELGRGEFGKVMQGIWTNDNGQKVQVAVKCLSPERFDEKGAQDFIKEAAIMHSLNHQHLVKLFGLVLDMDSSLVLVTEFAPLRSLCENLKQTALRISFPVNLLLDFTQQIAEAMKYLHFSNIIHRDLATRNILLFVDDEGSKLVKISDFGLSRRLMFEENYRSEMRPNLKLPLAWMPVEALTKLTFTRASDVWSFGVTMWEMFSYGCQPWATKSGEEILRAIDRPNLQRLVKPEACPSQVYELILKCWRHEPESRPTFTEISEELPKMKPLQVRAVTNYQGSREEELSYRAEDVITVLDANDDTGVWRGVTADGHIGLFHRSNTTLVGGSGGGKLKRWKSGSKGSNKAEHRKRVDSPKTPKRSPSKLTTLDISTPSEYKHVFHVGYDGRIQGDPTFGGDYRSLPSGSSPSKSDQWSSASSTSSRSTTSTPHRSPSTTPSKSPTFPSVSIAPRSNHRMTNDPPVTTSSQPELRAGIPITSQPRVRLAEDESWDSEYSLTDDQSLEGAAVSGAGASATTPDDELSLSLSLDFGSLLDDVMTAWDATRTSVGIDHPLTTSISEEGANGNTSGRSSPTSSIDEDLHITSLSASSQSQGIIMVGEQGARLSSSPEEGSLDSLPPLHNAITKDMPSNPVKTYRRTHSSSQSSAASGTSAYSSQSAPKDSAYDSRDGDVEEMSYTRLSSGVSDGGENEMMEDMDDYNEAPSPMEQRLNGQTEAAAEVNGNGHISHESRVDEVLDGAGDYTDLAAPDHDIRYKDSEFESMSASSSYSSRVNSQISKASTDSDDERPLRIVTNRQESMSSDHSERLGGGSPTIKPRSPRKPKCPPPPRPKGPPPTKPKASPPPVPPAPWKKPPRASNDQYANHSARRSGSEEEEVYSVSALRQRFDLARRNGAGASENAGRRGSGESYTRAGRSGSYKESVNIQASVGRSNSVGSYDSGKEEAEVKLSDRTLESLERALPRRTRRSVGESKHKRRTSSEEGTESDRSSMASSRASEGDSSSDEGATKVTASYPSATCPLPDLPEDQTNHYSSATHHPHPYPHDNVSPTPPRQAQITPSQQTPQESPPRPRLVRQGNTTPPFSPPEDALLKQRRSQSFDAGMRTRSQTFPERNPFRQKRHSVDILDTEGSHVVTSPEQIRELLNIRKDNKDMPSRTPPPVPQILSKTQSIGLGTDGQHKRSRAPDYEFMLPQTNLSPPHDLQDSDSGVDSPQAENRYGGVYKLLQSDNSQEPNDLAMRYVRMGSPVAIRRDIDIGEGKFTRSRSAHIIKWTNQAHQETSPQQQHRWEDVTTVARSKFKDDGKRLAGRRSLASRKSRSVDDLLSVGGEYAELREAESLRDVLARTYVPPMTGDSSRSADQQGIYLVPRSWKTARSPDRTSSDDSNLTPPSAVSIVVHPSAPAPPQQSSPASEALPPPSLQGHFVKDRNDPGYIDMASPSPEVYRSPPSFKTATIPEEETVSPTQTSDAYISLADCEIRSSPVKETNIVANQSEELHSSQSSLASSGYTSSGYSNYDVPPTRLKSSRSPSKEQHVLPNQPISTESSPNRTTSLTKTLSQDVPLPKRRQVRFNSNVESHDDDVDREESDVPDAVLQSAKARELKEQLPREIPVKCCFEALRDTNWDIEAAKHQLLIRHLAETQAVEECACESALRQCNWNLREAIDVLNDSPELSVSL